MEQFSLREIEKLIKWPRKYHIKNRWKGCSTLVINPTPSIIPYNQEETPNSHPVRGENGLDHTSSTPPFKPATHRDRCQITWLVPSSFFSFTLTLHESLQWENGWKFSGFAMYILYLQIIWSLNVLFSGVLKMWDFVYCFSWWYPYFCAFWTGSWPYLWRHCSNQSMPQEQKMIK